MSVKRLLPTYRLEQMVLIVPALLDACVRITPSSTVKDLALAAGCISMACIKAMQTTISHRHKRDTRTVVHGELACADRKAHLDTIGAWIAAWGTVLGLYASNGATTLALFLAIAYPIWRDLYETR